MLKQKHVKIFEADKQGLILCDRKSFIKIAMSLEEFLVPN